LPGLRDSLLGVLAPLTQPGAPTGSRAVLTQLTLSLADLALQMPEWTNAVQSMIEQFGKNPATVVVLLRFLGSLAEESLNPRLPSTVSLQDSYLSDF
jgi:transportin-3